MTEEDKKSQTLETQDAKESTCPICAEDSCEEYWLKCPKCKFATCYTCTTRYLMDLISLETPCMSCKAQWDYAYLHDNLPESFFYKYQIKKASILQEREKSLLPQTQTLIEEEKRTKKISELSQRVATTKRTLIHASNNVPMIVVDILNKRINELDTYLHQNPLYQNLTRRREEKKQEKKTIDFFGHCPREDCKGYLVQDIEEKHEEGPEEQEENEEAVVSPTKKKKLCLKCPLCDLKACPHCRIEKHKGKCNSDLVKNIKALEKETKPCPGCKIRIYKIDGCDQMFCMQCHTAFSWTHGVIETGRIHNPHYYEWLRKNGKQPAREPEQCQPIGIYNLHNVLQNVCKLSYYEADEYHRRLSNIFEKVGHINHVVLPTYTDVIDGTNSRIKYLKNELSERQWIFNLKRKLKDSYKNKSIRDVLTMLYAATNDIFSLILNSKSRAELDEYLQQLGTLREYANETFVKIGKLLTHNKLIPIITDTWIYKTSRTVKGAGGSKSSRIKKTPTNDVNDGSDDYSESNYTEDNYSVSTEN